MTAVKVPDVVSQIVSGGVLKAISDASGLRCDDPSLARQEFAEEVDINTIIRRFRLDGELPEGVRQPLNGDFSNVPDFQTALNLVRSAQESFAAMPARVRARFENDAAQFVDFCSDPANAEEARQMGLVQAPPVVTAAAPGVAPVVAPSAFAAVPLASPPSS